MYGRSKRKSWTPALSSEIAKVVYCDISLYLIYVYIYIYRYEARQARQADGKTRTAGTTGKHGSMPSGRYVNS